MRFLLIYRALAAGYPYPDWASLQNQKAPAINRDDRGYIKIIRRRLTLPQGLPSSIISAQELNFRVRNGDGCGLLAIATELK